MHPDFNCILLMFWIWGYTLPYNSKPITAQIENEASTGITRMLPGGSPANVCSPSFIMQSQLSLVGKVLVTYQVSGNLPDVR